MKNSLTNLELAKLLLKLFKEHKKYFFSGLCGFIIALRNHYIIDSATYLELNRFVDINDPSGTKNRIWYSRFQKESDSAYYFKRCDYNRRLRFLKSLVKKYSKK